MAAFSDCPLGCHISRVSCSRPWQSPEHSLMILTTKHRSLVLSCARKRIIWSALRELKQNVRNTDTAVTYPGQIFLPELVVENVKLQRRNLDSLVLNGFNGGITLDVLETDLNATICALKKKEEDLRHAEERMVADHADLNHTKQQLERSNQEIRLACAKKKGLEEDLEKANKVLVTQANQIEDLKLLIDKQVGEIIYLQSALSQKEKQLNSLENELLLKAEYIEKMNLEIEDRHLVLNDANKLIESQKVEIGELEMEVRLKEENLTKLINTRNVEQDVLRAADGNLEKLLREWSAAMKEIDDLTKQASKNTSSMEVSEDFKRVNALLSVVKSELMSSKEYIASRKSELMDQTQLESQWKEISKDSFLVASHARSLNEAMLEIERERNKLEAAEAQIMEFKSKLALERKKSEYLLGKLNKDKNFLDEKNGWISSLQTELQMKESSFRSACNIIRAMERDLTEVRLEIQQLKSEQASLRLIIDKKDGDLQSTQQLLFNMSNETLELQNLLNRKEDQLIKLAARLEENENHTITIKHDLQKVTLKFPEASSMIQRIFQVTSQLVCSIGPADDQPVQLVDEDIVPIIEVGSKSVQQLQREIKTTMTKLRTRELEVRPLQTKLKVTEKELHGVLNKQDSGQEVVRKTAIPENCIDIVEKRSCTSSSSSNHDVYGGSLKLRSTHIDSLTYSEFISEDPNGTRKLLEFQKEVASLLALTERLVSELDVNMLTGRRKNLNSRS